LASELINGVEALGWSPFRSPSDPSSCDHIVALRHPVVDVRRVQRVLTEEHRIICSSRGGNLRVSLHLYNDASDVETLVAALDTLV
jgi:selenocysteine lyase/cysteine desulfurase